MLYYMEFTLSHTPEIQNIFVFSKNKTCLQCHHSHPQSPIFNPTTPH